jgi:hypothetical protein
VVDAPWFVKSLAGGLVAGWLGSRIWHKYSGASDDKIRSFRSSKSRQNTTMTAVSVTPIQMPTCRRCTQGPVGDTRESTLCHRYLEFLPMPRYVLYFMLLFFLPFYSFPFFFFRLFLFFLLS